MAIHRSSALFIVRNSLEFEKENSRGLGIELWEGQPIWDKSDGAFRNEELCDGVDIIKGHSIEEFWTKYGMFLLPGECFLMELDEKGKPVFTKVESMLGGWHESKTPERVYRP